MITDEMVEKAARAINETFAAFSWEEISQSARDHYHDFARAALSAVLPDIVEQCAKIAEMSVDDAVFPGELAREIRSLASLSFQDGKT